jgi:hypothetical protein
MIFWNGNKSPARQRHELEVLKTLLQASAEEDGGVPIIEDKTDYPCAEDEGNIFNKGTDLLVTVAGNEKFAGKDKIEINIPIAMGLLGKRVLIVREERLGEFAAINSAAGMKRMTIGIPATWADAGLFRANGYPVVEKGSFEDIFARLKLDEFDYVALGANEVEEAYSNLARPLGGLAIEPALLIHYPMPLVFYVHPEQPELVKRIATGLKQIQANGRLEEIFEAHYGTIAGRLCLDQRHVIRLSNPMLQDWMEG